MVWCQATTHYHSQCWLRSMSPYVVIKLWWVNYICIAITCNQYDEITRLITVRHARLYVRCTVSLELSTSTTLVRTVECPLWSYIACFRKVSMVELQQVVWYIYIYIYIYDIWHAIQNNDFFYKCPSSALCHMEGELRGFQSVLYR